MLLQRQSPLALCPCLQANACYGLLQASDTDTNGPLRVGAMRSTIKRRETCGELLEGPGSPRLICPWRYCRSQLSMQTVKLWDPLTGEMKSELRGHDNDVLVVAFAPIAAYPAIRELAGIPVRAARHLVGVMPL